ncbi:MAG TPA: hypothetical protein DDX91_03600 [Ruminococcaceae bacterium]|nr:hypothetical protein [Oscillospiraceae bacterium]
MVTDYGKVRKIIERAYEGTCTVVEYKDVLDKDSGITRKKEKVTAEGLPCKLSFELNYPAAQTDTVSEVSQRAKLFISPDVYVKNGSKLIVEQYGKRTEYCCCGETAVYPTHREIRVAPFVKWT